MPRKPAIPNEVRTEVERIITDFNRRTFRNSGIAYSAHYRGKHLYLKRNEYGKPIPICCLTYTGDMNRWEFAIFKYTDERYADHEMFPGMGEVDGTVEGAMRAGLEAYQV
ncbi:MAG: hypothetical protein ISS57_01550 [Anaerolineales bacterium]|nr:hypothetical protein [Chloroflexota bacterium]MBL7161261.1 hypothetical protein [Anaerolineales bacterium]